MVKPLSVSKVAKFPDICDTTNSPFISERWVEWHIEGEIHSLQSLVLDDGSQEYKYTLEILCRTTKIYPTKPN